MQNLELPRYQLSNVERRTREIAPGRLRLATRPTCTGSAAVGKTMGMVVVADLAASLRLWAL